jgi:hypothetical protein
MTEELRALLHTKIEIIPQGTVTGLKELFGNDWDLIGTNGEKKSFGKEVKKLVQNGAIQNLRHQGITNDGRNDIYVKV